MHNVAPSRALARRARQWLTVAFVVAAIGVFIGVIGLALYVVPLAAPGGAAYGGYVFVRLMLLVVGLIVFLVGVGIGVRAATFKTDNDLALATGKFLAQYLDARYHFIRSVSRKGLGYIDAVLVGPPGALVFRILDDSGYYLNEGANWLRRDPRGQWQPAGIHPTRDAVEDIQRLRAYLAERKLGDVPVYGVVVFTREAPAVQLMAREPVVPVTTLSALVTNLGANYLAKERMDAARVGAVMRLLYEV